MNRETYDIILAYFCLVLLTIPIIWLIFFTDYEKGYWTILLFKIENNQIIFYYGKYYFWNRFYIAYETNCYFFVIFDLLILYFTCCCYLLYISALIIFPLGICFYIILLIKLIKKNYIGVIKNE